ncbi:BTB-kelch protein [Quillaja saponaria]|uniref:BTB-kelch protein n=1 Tax=Quillaja saponaria TaxID=32244 RepID=A0AAD7VJ59_QUISA|nr:BTB-kelch protein [Quillaja saponaria]
MGSLGGETARRKAMWLYPKVLGFNPSERWGHSACFSDGVMYIFGGCCGGLHFSDVLILNLETMAWSTLATTGQGPGRRDSHSAVLVGQRMIVFGGTNGSKKVNDVHILDLGTKEWTQPECKGTHPSPRESHTATLVGDERLVIFGGSGEGDRNYLNDLHILDLQTMRWSSPETVVITIMAMLIRLDMDTMTWTRLAVQGSSPGVRAGHAAVSIGTKVYVIGGVGDKHYYNDVWILDVSTCSWTRLDMRGQQPQGRFSHTAVVADSDIAIYGGCGEDERPLDELLVLQLGAEHPNGRYNISMCKIFGNHWNQEKRRFLRGADKNLKTILMGNNVEVLRKGTHGIESEMKQPFQFDSDTLHRKRKRTANPKVWDVESEQEEHSLSLSQQSSPSQSDQEQNPTQKANASVMGSQGFHLFKQLNHIPSGCQPDNISSNQKVSKNIIQRTRQDLYFVENQDQPKQDQFLHVHMGRQAAQYPAVEPKTLEARPIQNLIGAEVRGKVDGAFDSGFLMTANVNGRILRGVLFSPGPAVVSRGNTLVHNSSFTSQFATNTQPFPSSSHVDNLRPSQQPVTSSMPESCQRPWEPQVIRPFPIGRATPHLAKDQKIRSDLQGVVLTLGGPC